MGTVFTKELGTKQLSLVALVPTIWQHANFSDRWYLDLVGEAGGAAGQDSKRKEIVFAASFLESYIFEWARSVCRLDGLNQYFPPNPRRFRTLTEKWAQVPAELFRDKVIATRPQLDLSQLGTLVKYRHGLIHAQASRPMNSDLPDEAQPVPALGELDRLKHGWAHGVAKKLVLELHQQLGTVPPDYL